MVIKESKRDNMDFSDALRMLKQGKRMSREGWNGKGMFIFATMGRDVPISEWMAEDYAHRPTPIEKDRGYVTLLPHIDMYTSDGKRCTGWLASQTDLFAEDWVIIE